MTAIGAEILSKVHGRWAVLRHSGRHEGKWRSIYAGSDEHSARAKFDSDSEDLRQGTVVLLAPDGTVVECIFAPRLRTRW